MILSKKLPIIALTIGLIGITNYVCNAADSPARTAAQKPKPAEPDPLVQVKDVEGLPRVLLIGDSISIGYTLPVRELLKGKANVHRPPENCHATSDGVKDLERWLGDKKWDLIHFNFGMHDFKHVNKDGKSVPDPKDPSGHENVSPEDYEKNLRTIVARLKKTGAKLIWCSTTPLPANVQGGAARVPGDEVKYNEIAAKVMKENNIAINDLHSFAKPRLKKIQRPKDVHFPEPGSKVLAKEVAKVIEDALKK
jgi:acyl-CoA thioesterase-1